MQVWHLMFAFLMMVYPMQNNSAWKQHTNNMAGEPQEWDCNFKLINLISVSHLLYDLLNYWGM